MKTLNIVIQGDSLARGLKLLSIKKLCQSINGWRTNYWLLPARRCNMSHFKCYHARNLKFFSRQNYVKKPLATQISRSNACRLLSLGPIEGQSVQNYTPHKRTNSKTLNAKRFKPSTPTLEEKYSRIWRNAFKCAWMWKETSFSVDYEQVLFCIVPGKCI